MPLALYMDHHVSRVITSGLRLRGVDVLTAAEDGAARLPDPALLDRVHDLGRVLFSQDQDFLKEAWRRQQAGESFAGILYAHQARVPASTCISDLELIAKTLDPDELRNQVTFLPL